MTEQECTNQKCGRVFQEKWNESEREREHFLVFTSVLLLTCLSIVSGDRTQTLNSCFSSGLDDCIKQTKINSIRKTDANKRSEDLLQYTLCACLMPVLTARAPAPFHLLKHLVRL